MMAKAAREQSQMANEDKASYWMNKREAKWAAKALVLASNKQIRRAKTMERELMAAEDKLSARLRRREEKQRVKGEELLMASEDKASVHLRVRNTEWEKSEQLLMAFEDRASHRLRKFDQKCALKKTELEKKQLEKTTRSNIQKGKKLMAAEDAASAHLRRSDKKATRKRTRVEKGEMKKAARSLALLVKKAGDRKKRRKKMNKNRKKLDSSSSIQCARGRETRKGTAAAAGTHEEATKTGSVVPKKAGETSNKWHSCSSDAALFALIDQSASAHLQSPSPPPILSQQLGRKHTQGERAHDIVASNWKGISELSEENREGVTIVDVGTLKCAFCNRGHSPEEPLPGKEMGPHPLKARNSGNSRMAFGLGRGLDDTLPSFLFRPFFLSFIPVLTSFISSFSSILLQSAASRAVVVS
jgi:hypothetical protein